MGACSTGWIGGMGLIYKRGCVMGVRDWIGVMALMVGLRHGGARHWLDQRDGIDSLGHATLAGSRRWY